MKKICILGATGSIGTNCLDVVASQPSEFEVRYLTTYQNVALLLQQAELLRFYICCFAAFESIGVLITDDLAGGGCREVTAYD